MWSTERLQLSMAMFHLRRRELFSCCTARLTSPGPGTERDGDDVRASGPCRSWPPPDMTSSQLIYQVTLNNLTSTFSKAGPILVHCEIDVTNIEYLPHTKTAGPCRSWRPPGLTSLQLIYQATLQHLTSTYSKAGPKLHYEIDVTNICQTHTKRYFSK